MEARNLLEESNKKIAIQSDSLEKSIEIIKKYSRLKQNFDMLQAQEKSKELAIKTLQDENVSLKQQLSNYDKANTIKSSKKISKSSCRP